MKKEVKIVFKFTGRRSGLTMQMMDLISQADKEGKTLFTNSQLMYDALTEKGIKAELINLPGDYILRVNNPFQLLIDEKLRNPQKTTNETLYWSMYDTEHLKR